MKHQINKYSDIIVINLISFLVGLVLYNFIYKKPEILFAPIATGISLAMGLRQYKTENDKLFKTLFTEFNSKYDSVFNNRLIIICKVYRETNCFVLSDEDKILIIDYLNFCAEEFLWYSLGRIPDVVWKSWRAGMLYYLNVSCINKFILSEKTQQNSYYNLFNELSGDLNNWT
jgi:hypothetical protein